MCQTLSLDPNQSIILLSIAGIISFIVGTTFAMNNPHLALDFLSWLNKSKGRNTIGIIILIFVLADIAKLLIC